MSTKPPGQWIVALLEERGWTQRILASVLDVNESTVHRIISGKQPVTAELALALGEVFNENAERFLGLQKDYDLAMARMVARPDPGRQDRALLLSELPIKEMISRGWIDAKDQRDFKSIELELARFFGVGSVAEIEFLPHAAKKTNVSDVTPVQLAWLYRVKQIAAA